MSQKEQTVKQTDKFKDLQAMRLAHAALVTLRRETGVSPEFLEKVSIFVAKGVVTGVNLDNLSERKSAQSMLDYWDNILQREGLAEIDPTLADFDLESQPELPDQLCPYVGLYAFQENDQQVFYGRQRLVVDLMSHLSSNPFLSVVGPSGSGKSSVVRAGLLPELKTSALSEGQDVQFLPAFVPGASPLANLAKAIKPQSVPPEWTAVQAGHFLDNSQHLAQLLSEHYEGNCVLFIDQFEETFTLCLDEAERLAFAQNLLSAIQIPEANHRIILTLRTDFEPFIQRLSPKFANNFEKSRVRVMPLNAAELREAILKPADNVDLHFEDGIVDGLLQDLLGEPAALPLLQFTLLKLWEKRERNRVPLAAYEVLGGGRLALANSADALYNDLILEEQVTMRRILLRMVRPGEGLEVTNNRIQRNTLYQAGEAQDRVDRVLDKLVAARLVRISDPNSPNAQVEVAHEALIRNWPLLVEWLDEERVVMRQRLRLTTAAEEWDRLGRDPNALWRGVMLIEAQSYSDLNQLEIEFVNASLSAEEAERKREIRRYQFFAVVLGSFLFVALIAAGVAFYQRQNAVESAEVARQAKNEAEVLAAQANNAKATADVRAAIASTALADQIALLELARDQVLTPLPRPPATRTRPPDEEEIEMPPEESETEMATDLPDRATAVPAPTLSFNVIEEDISVVQEAIVQNIDVQLDAVRATQEAVSNEILLDSQSNVIGYSVEGEPIEIVQYGSGPNKIVLVGGIHYGLAPSTVRLIDGMKTHYAENPGDIPDSVTLYFVTNLNPDSTLAPGRVEGRFNANGVDLNRNWDCRWTANPNVRGVIMEGAGGSEPLSEPETKALADFFRQEGPDLAIIYDAPISGGLVTPGGCDGINKFADILVPIYAKASGYKAEQISGNDVQGDISNWLDAIGIPAFFVILPSATLPQVENNVEALQFMMDEFSE